MMMMTNLFIFSFQGVFILSISVINYLKTDSVIYTLQSFSDVYIVSCLIYYATTFYDSLTLIDTCMYYYNDYRFDVPDQCRSVHLRNPLWSPETLQFPDRLF